MAPVDYTRSARRVIWHGVSFDTPVGNTGLNNASVAEQVLLPRWENGDPDLKLLNWKILFITRFTEILNVV